MNMREEFEAWAVNRGQSVLRQGPGYAAERTGMAWEAWQASRSTLLVKLPRPPETLTDTDLLIVVKATIVDCAEAIESAGVKVKP